MDNDAPAYKKKKASRTSKSASRSDHKHEYDFCIVRYMFFYEWGERCRVCGRTRTKWSRTHDFLRPEAIGKPGIGDDDYLSVKELRDKFRVNVYEQYWEGHELKTKEVFE